MPHIIFIIPSMKPHDIMYSSTRNRFIVELYYISASHLISQPTIISLILSTWWNVSGAGELRSDELEQKTIGTLGAGLGNTVLLHLIWAVLLIVQILYVAAELRFSTRCCSEPNNQHPVHGRRQPFSLTRVPGQNYWISKGSL